MNLTIYDDELSYDVTHHVMTTAMSFNDTTESPSTTVANASRSGDVLDAVVLCAYSTVMFMSIFGNGLVVLTIATYRRMRSVTNYFIVSLAGADLLIAVGIPFTLASSWAGTRWPFASVLCPIITYLQTVAVFLSSFTLVGLSVDRFRAVVYPLRPRITVRQTGVTIGLIWLLAASVPLPIAIVSRVNSESGTCEEQWLYDSWKSAFSVTLLVLQYFLPLGVLVATYSVICYVIWVKKEPGLSQQSGRDRRLAVAKRKIVKMMIVVVVVYALCWLPLHGIHILGDMYPATIWDYKHIQPIWMGCHWLAMSSCCWNPIIYCWKNDTFRAGFLYALLGRCPCRSIRRRTSHLFDQQPAVSPSMAAAAAPFCLGPRSRTGHCPSAAVTVGVPSRVHKAAAAPRPTRGGSIRAIAAQVAKFGRSSTAASTRDFAVAESVMLERLNVPESTRTTRVSSVSVRESDDVVAIETGSNRLVPAATGAKKRVRQLCKPSLSRKLNCHIQM